MKQIPASSIYCIRGGEVLLLQRSNPPMVGQWVAPGGKIDPNESPFEAAIRELQEETGLIATDLRLRGIVTETSPLPEWQWMIFYFVATAFDGELTAKSEEGNLQWWPLDQIHELNVPEADRVFTEPILDLEAPVYQAHFRYDMDLRLVSISEHSSGQPTLRPE